GGGRDDRVVTRCERDDERCHRFRDPVCIARVVGKQDLRYALELRGRFRDRPASAAGDENMDIVAQCAGGGQRLRSRAVERFVVVLGDQERGHYSTPASLRSLSTSSSTEATFTPPLRPAGSLVLSTFRRGATSTP